MTEKIKKKVTTIYLPENLLAQLKREAKEDFISFNQRCLSLILIGRRAESSNERDNERNLREIRRLVQEEYKRQSQAEYINSDRERPLNRYELEKEREQERQEQEPDIPATPKPRSDFERIYGSTSEKYSGELDDDVMEDWKRSNFHPFFHK